MVDGVGAEEDLAVIVEEIHCWGGEDVPGVDDRAFPFFVIADGNEGEWFYEGFDD